MTTAILSTGVLAACFGACLFSANLPDPPGASNSWNRQAAAAYLDKREAWWMTWPVAARDHGTFCVSCHTALPYALARPALRNVRPQDGDSIGERTLLADVTKRVRLGTDAQPFYND